jgi:hypothetical protein
MMQFVKYILYASSLIILPKDDNLVLISTDKRLYGLPPSSDAVQDKCSLTFFELLSLETEATFSSKIQETMYH